MKKVLALVLLIVVLSPIIALASYSATITTINTNTVAYDSLPVMVMMDNQWMIDNGITNTYATDVAVKSTDGLTIYPTLVAQDRTLFARNVAVGNTLSSFTTGNTAVVTNPVIVGVGGYVTTADSAIEMGSDYELTVSNTYWDLDTYNMGAVFSKKVAGTANTEAFRLSPAPDGAIVAQNYGAVVNTINQAGSLGAGSATIGGVAWVAQTFTPVGNLRVASVELNLSQGVGPVPVTVAIRQYNLFGVTIGGATLASYTEVASNTSVGFAWNIFHLPPVLLSAGTTYALVVSAPTGALGASYAWSTDNTNPYAGGQEYTSADSGLTWTATAANDFTFRINTATDTVSATGLTSGVINEVKVTQSGIGVGETMTLWINGVAANTIVPTVAVPNNAADWLWLHANTAQLPMAYLGGVNLKIGAANVLNYGYPHYIQGIAYNAGTAAFTNGSAVVVGTTTFWNQDMVGGVIKYNADNQWYAIRSVQDATHLTLIGSYLGAGGAAAAYTSAPYLITNVGTLVPAAGAITWGTNYFNISASTGTLVPSGSSAGAAGDPVTNPGVISPSPGLGAQNAGSGTTGLNPDGSEAIPFAGFIGGLVTQVNLPHPETPGYVAPHMTTGWVFMVIFAVIDMVAMIFVARTGSMMLMGATGLTLLVVECQAGIYNWWVLILAVVIAAVWWIMQRAPVI